MQAENCYLALEPAKDGSLIPLAGESPSGGAKLSLHSRYNPQREAQIFAEQAGNADFFIVLGLAGGYHIQALLKRYEQASVLVIEKPATAFLSDIPCVRQLLTDSRVHVTAPAGLEEALLSLFRPAEHDRLEVLTLRAWEGAFPETARDARSCIQKTLQAISADYSVQSHFGGIWQRNIFMNLQFFSGQQKFLQPATAPAFFSAPEKKTAAIIAAGPSLDENVHQLLKNRRRYFIIATDTGYQALKARGIASDVCISVDAQLVSHGHFFNADSKTRFFCDISSPPAVLRFLASRGAAVQLFESGHPISKLAASFPHLETGSGTVTIAATDFAIQAGFTRIAFFGADFAYRAGKAYTRGSYLDTIYNTQSSRLCPSEELFTRLMYRTELQAVPGGMTTELLASYRRALESFLAERGWKKESENCYRSEKRGGGIKSQPFDYSSFLQAYKEHIQRDSTLLLPFAAWLKQKNPELPCKKILSLAQSLSLVYTEGQ